MFTRELRNILLVLYFIFVVHLLLLPATALSTSNEISVAMYGGSFGESCKDCFIKPFEKKYDCKVNVVLGNSKEFLARLRAQKGYQQLDIVTLDRTVSLQAKAEGLIDKYDPEKIPNFRDLYDWAKDPDGYYGALYLDSVGLAYNPEMIKRPPISWLELWDPKYKGKITIPDMGTGPGYGFLLMAAKLHGGNQVNIDPGFEAIKKLKVVKHFLYSGEVVSLLERKEVVMAVWGMSRTWAANKGGIPVTFAYPKEGVVSLLGDPCIVKGGPNKEYAEKYINFVFAHDAQKCFTESEFMGPVNKKTILSPEFLKNTPVPYGTKSKIKLYIPDFEYVNKHRGEWTERWNREIR